MESVVETLQSADISAEKYSRGPIGNHIFAVGVTPDGAQGTIKLWEGDAKVEVIATDKHFRQAVVDVDEKRHEIKRNIKITVRPIMNRDGITAINMLGVARMARNRFDIALPEGSTLRTGNITDITPRSWKRRKYRADEKRFEVEVIASVPSFHQNLLMGFDEKYHFIAALSSPAKSVKEAHDLLLPEEARGKRSVQRQGEWFFIPQNAKMRQILDEYVAADMTRLRERYFESGTHGGKSVAFYEGKTYAIGVVFDYRSSHHDFLMLNDWHEVVRNREVITATRRQTNRSVRSFRWD